MAENSRNEVSPALKAGSVNQGVHQVGSFPGPQREALRPGSWLLLLPGILGASGPAAA